MRKPQKGKKPSKFSDNVVLDNYRFGGSMKRKRRLVQQPTVRGTLNIQRVLDEAKDRKLRGLKL